MHPAYSVMAARLSCFAALTASASKTPRKFLSHAIWLLVFSVMVLLSFSANEPAHAQDTLPMDGTCAGIHGLIDVPRASVPGMKWLQNADLESIVGGYCDDSNGQFKSGTLEDNDVSCSASISADGTFSIRVGAHPLEFLAAPGSLASSTLIVGSSTAAKTYGVMASQQKSIPEGTELVSAEFDVQFQRVVLAVFERSWIVNGVKSKSESFRCAFHRKTAFDKMVSGSILYASGENVTDRLAGTFHGLASSTVDGEPAEVPCTLQIESQGRFTLTGPAASRREGAIVTASGTLEGRLWDSVNYNSDGIQIMSASTGDPWHWPSGTPKAHVVTVKFGADYYPVSADGTDDAPAIGDPERSISTCKFLPPSQADEQCETEACQIQKAGLGTMSCAAAWGNPVNVANGNKFQYEVDFPGVGSGQLRFERFYNSNAHATAGRMGSNWRSTYDRSLTIDSQKQFVRAFREDGKVINFRKLGEQWSAAADVNSVLRSASGGPVPNAAWSIRTESDTMEFYDAAGKLLRVVSREGRLESLGYDSLGRLETVTDGFGRSLRFEYDQNNRIASMKDPIGSIFSYRYDTWGNLEFVIAPGTPAATQRQYIYDKDRIVHALTGIEDENGVRYATWTYDSIGRAKSSEHAGGVDSYHFGYQGNGTTIVTDPQGADQTLSFVNVLGGMKYMGETQPAGAGCSAAYSSAAFDENGNLKWKTDFNGVVTKYTFDVARNLELSRTEASGTASARTISSRWHPVFRLESAIAGPKLITTFERDTSGNLLSVIQQATADLTGAQGFAAIKVGAPRKWSMTYDGIGNLQTVKSPRIDADTTNYYTYEESGNLKTARNALGHITTFSNYDARGLVGRITLPNKVTTDIQYNLRGAVISRLVTGGEEAQLTTYEYDPVGQLIKVTLPNQGFIKIDYDGAHRLIGIADNLGNTMRYGLDNSGNRISEQTRDPGGALARQITREYDVLNRLKAQTGAAQ